MHQLQTASCSLRFTAPPVLICPHWSNLYWQPNCLHHWLSTGSDKLPASDNLIWTPPPADKSPAAGHANVPSRTGRAVPVWMWLEEPHPDRIKISAAPAPSVKTGRIKIQKSLDQWVWEASVLRDRRLMSVWIQTEPEPDMCLYLKYMRSKVSGMTKEAGARRSSFQSLFKANYRDIISRKAALSLQGQIMFLWTPLTPQHCSASPQFMCCVLMGHHLLVFIRGGGGGESTISCIETFLNHFRNFK